MSHVTISNGRDYADVLLWLEKDKGCSPSASKRGSMVRFYVNRYGNFWGDGETVLEACEEAVNNWIDAGMPKEGVLTEEVS